MGTNPTIIGDPAFTGLLNGVDVNGTTASQKYAVTFQSGDTANILSDTGIQMNGHLNDPWGIGDVVFDHIGVKVLGSDGQTYKVDIKPNAAPVVTFPDNHQETVSQGQTVDLGGNDQTVTWNGSNLVSLNTKEYDADVSTHTNDHSFLDVSVKTTQGYDGQNEDGVLGVSGRTDLIGKVQDGTGLNGVGVVTQDANGNGANRQLDDYLIQNGDVFADPTKFNSFKGQ